MTRSRKTKATITHPALATWVALQPVLRTADEALCEELLAKEKNGRNRRLFVLRIFSRLNRVRGQRERREVLKSK